MRGGRGEEDKDLLLLRASVYRRCTRSLHTHVQKVLVDSRRLDKRGRADEKRKLMPSSSRLVDTAT